MVDTQNGWQNYTSGIGSALGYSSAGNGISEYDGNKYYDDNNSLHIGGDGRPYVYVNGKNVPATKVRTPTDPTDYFKRFSNPTTAYTLGRLHNKYGTEKGKVVRYRGNYYISDGTSWSPYTYGGYSNNGSTYGKASV